MCANPVTLKLCPYGRSAAILLAASAIAREASLSHLLVIANGVKQSLRKEDFPSKGIATLRSP